MSIITNKIEIEEPKKELIVPKEIYNDKKLFQKWFLTHYLSKFHELPEALISIERNVKNERSGNKKHYFETVSKTVSFSMFGRDETGRLLDKSRVRELVTMRKMICYILVRKLGFSLTWVGRMLEKDHATVLYLCKCAENHMKYDKNFSMVFSETQQNLIKLGIIW